MTTKAASLKRIKQTGVLSLNGLPDDTFPLFTAEGEYHWIPGWDPELIYPNREKTEDGTIFISSDIPGHKTYWLTVSYDPETRRAIYSSVTPDVWIMRLDVACDPGPDDTTIASMTFTFTGLSKAGNNVVEQMFGEKVFEARARQMEQWINHYLAHGKPMEAEAGHKNIHMRISDWLSGN